MANSLNGLSLTVIAQEALPVLQVKVPVFDLFSTDFSSEVSNVGAGISTRIPASVTATAYNRSAGYVDTGVTSSVITVNLTNHKHFTMGFDDKEVSTLGADKLMGTFIQPAIDSIMNDMQSQLYSSVTTASFASSTYSASYANFNFSALMNGQKALDISGSSTPRCAILNVPTWYALLNDVKASYNLGDSTAIRQGQIGLLGNISVAQSPLVGSGIGLAGFIAGKDAFALAARVPAVANIDNVMEVANVTAPNGFTLQLRKWYSPDLGLLKISAVSINGYAVGQGSSLTRIITTD